MGYCIYTPWKKYSSLSKHVWLAAQSFSYLGTTLDLRFSSGNHYCYIFSSSLSIFASFLWYCSGPARHSTTQASGGKYTGVLWKIRSYAADKKTTGRRNARRSGRSILCRPPPTFTVLFSSTAVTPRLLAAPLAGLHVNAALRCQKMQVRIRLQFLAGCWQLSGEFAESRLAPGRESSRLSSCSVQRRRCIERRVGLCLTLGPAVMVRKELEVRLTRWKCRCSGEEDLITKHRHTHIYLYVF